jgi:hypothetical protein
MAITILPQDQNQQRAYDLGSGLSQGLQMLAQNKLGQMQQRHQQQSTARNLGMLGLPPEVAYGIAGLPAHVQKSVLNEYFAENGIGELPEYELGQPSGRRLGSAARSRLAQQEDIAHKESLPVYKDIVKAAHDAQDNITRLDRMQELVQRGNLPKGWFNAALESISDRFGIDLSGIQGADTQEFKKLSKDFVKNAKSFFGARITDQDLRTFLQTVPNLSQSDEGRQRVINNLRNMEEAKLVRKDALDKILKANKGKRPANLEEQIDKIAKPRLDKLAQEFKAGTYGVQHKKQTPENENFLSKKLREEREALSIF